MRLINYEEYKNKLLEIRDSIPLTVPAATYELMREKPYAQGMAMRGGIRKALKCLEQCQNVSGVAPVVHGRWIESKEHFYLNNGCKEWINFYCSECDAPNNSPTDYCPNCGAKMDGVDNG